MVESAETDFSHALFDSNCCEATDSDSVRSSQRLRRAAVAVGFGAHLPWEESGFKGARWNNG